MTGDDLGTNLGLDDGGHLAIGHFAGVGEWGDDADVTGCFVVQHQTAVARRGGNDSGAGRVGRQGEREHRAREHDGWHNEQRQCELAGIEIVHTF